MAPAAEVPSRHSLTRRSCVGGFAAASLVVLAACSGTPELFSSNPAPEAPQQSTAIGTGEVKVGLILPLSAGGNAGTVAQSMKNAAEMALAEFNSPNIQLLVKDDGGSSGGAQAGGAAGAGRRAPKSSSGRCLRIRSAWSAQRRASAAFR